MGVHREKNIAVDQGFGDYLIKKKTLWIKVCLGFYDFLSEKKHCLSSGLGDFLSETKTLWIYVLGILKPCGSRFWGFSEREKQTLLI